MTENTTFKVSQIKQVAWQEFLVEMEAMKRNEVQHVDMVTLVKNEYEDFDIGEECLMEPVIRRPTNVFINDFISLVKTVVSEEEQAQPRKRELAGHLAKMLEVSGHWNIEKFPRRASLQGRKFMSKLFDFAVKELGEANIQTDQSEDQQFRRDRASALIEISGICCMAFTPLAMMTYKSQGTDCLWKTYIDTEKFCSPFAANIIPTVGWCERKGELYIFYSKSPCVPEVLMLRSDG